MAIFGLFGRKDSKSAPPAEKKATTSMRAVPEMPSAAPPAQKQKRRDPAVSNATAKKIDAIESEMSSEFRHERPLGGSTLPGPPPGLKSPPAGDKAGMTTHREFESTLPSIGMSTEFLLGPLGKATDIEIVGTEAAQVVEEAAILYASDQIAMAEQVLRSAVESEALGELDGDGGLRAWAMLFDLYQLGGRQAEFDALSIAYASKFETSPPSWRGSGEFGELLPVRDMLPAKSAVPSVAFVGKLDGNIVRLLERVQKLGESNVALRLEFTRVSDVDPIGCGLLLRILKRLQATKHELVLVGARELGDKIRAILKVGRRDETEAPWLLLLELLRLLNAEQEFEETSMDYCVTFEVSPPGFEAPNNKVTTADAGAETLAAESFPMPAMVTGATEQLLGTITAFASAHDPAVLDCSGLRRIDFNAAGQLLSSLAPIAAGGRVIEFIGVNHLVAALFDVIGIKDFARVVVRKD
ncbi:MAG: hypothetical protein JWP36_2557 [Paucimonas sp.]|nr:hypothetical protein [Paucimonas sp.]